jgi:hypothetical protein
MANSKTGYITWSNDDNWSSPLIDSEEKQSFDSIDRLLFNRGLLCRAYGGEYAFIDTSNSWCNLASSEAIVRINAIAGITNATVNFEKAISAYLKYIIKRCNANVAKPIPTSVCIGTRRLEIEVDKEDSNIIKFYDCRPLLDTVSINANDRVKGLCIMPIDTTVVPTIFSFPGKGEILIHILRTFPDPRDLVTFMWHVGNSLIDPIAQPKSLMICGPGGSGKSTLLQHLYSCMIGCCGILPDGSLTGSSRSMNHTIAEAITSSRMAICYDVDLEKEPLNMAVFKNISGSDYVRVGQTSLKSNCSLSLATNGIVDVDKQPEYHSDAIMRRVVCILMNVIALSIPKSAPIPEDSETRLDFLCACIHTRISYEYIPVSPMSLLLTLCASKMDNAIALIEETNGPIDVFDGNFVLDCLSNIINCSKENVVIKAKLISPMCIFTSYGHTYIKGLRKRR